MNDVKASSASRFKQVIQRQSEAWLPLLTRALLLFVVLAAVKSALLFRLREHLFHSHWRLQMHEVGWFEAIAFSVFTLLLVASFVRLGTHCRKLPVKDIRWLNAGFIVIGLLFWFFTRYTAEYNYLYPVLRGWHTLGDVGNKVILDVFFAPPFLIIYLLLHPLLYWILARTKREHWSLPLLGAIAGFYFTVNQQSMVEFGTELTLISCFGIAGLATLYHGRGPLDGRWVLLPAGLVMLAWAAFLPYGDVLQAPAPYFLRFTVFALVLFPVVWFTARRNKAFPVLSHLLPFYALAFYLLANQHHPYAQNYNFVAAWGISLPGYLSGEVVVTVLLLALGLALFVLAGRKTIYFFDVLAIAIILTALVDYFLTTIMGVRLDWAGVTVVDSPKMIWRMAEPYLLKLVVGMVALTGLYAAGIWFVNRWLPSRLPALAEARRRTPGFVFIALFLAAASSQLYVYPDKARGVAAGNVATTSPLVKGWQVKRFDREEFVKRSQELGLPDFERAIPPPKAARRDLNLFVIVMESSYNRYLSLFGAPDETQPELKRYRDRLEVFPNFYSNFANSFHARFTVLSGFYATTEYASYLNPRIPSKSLFEIMADHGYVNTLFDSCFTEYARFRDYVGHRKLTHLYDFNNMPGRENYQHVSWGLDETCTMEAIKQQFTEHARNKERFCCVYLPVAPHYPFDSHSERFGKFDLKDAVLKKDFSARYKNQLLLMDWVIASLLDQLKELNLLDDTLVIITNDHGEMLGDVNGLLGHGWNLEPYLTNTPLIIMDPARTQYAVNRTAGSQIDVLPTILDLLHLPTPPDELYQGVSLYSTNAANPERPIFLTSHRHRALVQKNTYLLDDPQQHRPTGLQHMRAYDIHNEDARTVYEPVPAKRDISAQMDAFEKYQKSFIIHYGQYKKVMDRTKGATPK